MKPYYQDDAVTLYHGDCREGMLGYAPQVDAIVTDPPYGDTSLDWDRQVDGWLDLARQFTRQLWCFGSFRFWLERGGEFVDEGWRYGEDVIWEKHNGSGFHADRFKRVHEYAVHWYRGDWTTLYKNPPVTLDAVARTVKRRGRMPHTGEIGAEVDYETVDGGPRLQRSVIYVRSENGRAVHPTQKPLGILRPLIQMSIPPGGTVMDPFAGSGSTLLAAREMGRHAIGFELREDHCKAAVQRLAQGVLAA